MAEFDVAEAVGEAPAPSWNVAPTDAVRVIVARHPSDDREGEPVRQLRTVGWGLLPSWSRSRSGGAKMINARSETVSVKPAFKAAAARRRCLVPSAGYYEWAQENGQKIPYFLHAQDERAVAMAGLYEIWHDDSRPSDDEDAWVWTCTVITRAATDALGHIHDRCPVLVPPDLHEPWLDCRAADPSLAQRLLESIPDPVLVPRQVSRAVGNVRNDGPELVEAVRQEPEQLSLDTDPKPSVAHSADE